MVSNNNSKTKLKKLPFYHLMSLLLSHHSKILAFIFTMQLIR